MSIKCFNLIFANLFGLFRFFEGYWDPKIMNQRISMCVCTLPILIIIFLSDFGTIITSIISLILELTHLNDTEDDTCSNHAIFFIVSMVVYTLSLSMKLSIISIHYKNIRSLQDRIKGRFFRSLYLMNTIPLVMITVIYI